MKNTSFLNLDFIALNPGLIFSVCSLADARNGRRTEWGHIGLTLDTLFLRMEVQVTFK